MAKLTLSVNLDSPALKALLNKYPGVTPQRAIVGWINASYDRGYLSDAPTGLTIPTVEDHPLAAGPITQAPQSSSGVYTGWLDEE